jgi:hypothetical protein
VADRPLRPATRRSLGEPLPHQQADRPRAPLEAEIHFLTGSCGLMRASGISTGFPVLFRSSGQVAHVLRTRSPLGLHRCYHRMDLVRLACIKHAASVRPEPGSNSPSRSRHRRQKRRSEIGEPASRTLILHADKQPGRPRSARLLEVSDSHREDGCPHWLLAISVPFSRSVDRTLRLGTSRQKLVPSGPSPSVPLVEPPHPDLA